MCSASVQVIFESAETLNDDAEYFEHKNNASSTYELPKIDMSAIPIAAMVVTIGKLDFFVTQKSIIISFEVSKVVLLILCYRIKNPTMSALAEDNRNDVASNTVALICGLLGMIHFKIDCIFL